jgi:uncharacterized protein involved in type VI secretion and phage assembly
MSALDLLGDDDDRAGGPLPGLLYATVSDVVDPDELGRVKLTLPTLGDTVTTTWARVLAPGAGEKHGVYWPLEVGDEVLVAFIGGHPEHPVVMGALWSAKRFAAIPKAARRTHRVLASPAGHTLRMDDTKDAHKLEIVAAGGESSIAVDVAAGKLTITAKTTLEIKVGADITLTLKDGKVTIQCKEFAVKDATDVTVAGDAITLEAAKGLALTGNAGVNINDGALEVTK